MRIFLLLICSTVALHAQLNVSSPFYVSALLKPAASSCSVASGNITNESWEGSDSLTWSDTGTVNRNAALFGTMLAGTALPRRH